MNKYDKLGVTETRKISIDELLNDKPENLPFLQSINEEDGVYYLDVNKVTIFNIRKHKLVYGKNYVVIKFYDINNVMVANISAFGSCNRDKPDEHFYISSGSIISETGLRVMNGITD